MHYLKIVKMNGKKEISTLSSTAVFWKKKFHHLANFHASLNKLFHIPSILKTCIAILTQWLIGTNKVTTSPSVCWHLFNQWIKFKKDESSDQFLIWVSWSKKRRNSNRPNPIYLLTYWNFWNLYPSESFDIRVFG